MKTKKAQSQIVTTVLISLLVLAGIVIAWKIITTNFNPSNYEIYLNETPVYNLTYKTTNSIEMIESGNYPDYILCYSYCMNQGIVYNDTNIFLQCNLNCIQNFGVEKIIKDYELDEEWLKDNCQSNVVCATDVHGEETDECLGNYKCGNYRIEMKGG